MLKKSIRNKINKFFMTHLNEDVSNVEIKFEDILIDNTNGFYKRDEQNIIHVDKNLSGIELENVIVHEMEHLLQYNRDKSYTIKIRDIESLRNESISNCCYNDLYNDDINYYERRQEIDSRITTVIYAYTTQGLKGLIATYKSIYFGCTNSLLNNTVVELVNNMPDSEVKTFMLDSIAEVSEMGEDDLIWI